MLHGEDDIILIARHLTAIKRSIQYKSTKKSLTELQRQKLKRLIVISDDFMKKATLIRKAKSRACKKPSHAL
jgi:hypothetical protein